MGNSHKYRIFCMLFATLVIPHSLQAWDLPLDIDVIKIYFNHDTGSTSGDGITIQEDQTTITAPEWYPAASKNEESAYLMSVAAPTVKAEFYANDILEGYSTVTVYADFVSGDGSWELAEATMGFPGGGSGQVSFSTNVSYPQTSSVGKRSVTWTWKVTQVNGQAVSPFSIGTSTHTYYKVLATPQAPMEIPWIEVLDYSCVWASGRTSATDCASDITNGIYYNLGDTSGDFTYKSANDNYSPTEYQFRLSSFLYNINTQSNVEISCTSTANIFAIFSCALGLEAQTRRRHTNGSFTTYAIDVIGHRIPQWETFTWGAHQFGWYNNSVYDPCLRVYQANPILPCGMNQTLFESYLSPNYFDYTNTYTPSIIN